MVTSTFDLLTPENARAFVRAATTSKKVCRALLWRLHACPDRLTFNDMTLVDAWGRADPQQLRWFIQRLAKYTRGDKGRLAADQLLNRLAMIAEQVTETSSERQQIYGLLIRKWFTVYGDPKRAWNI